MAKAAPKTVYEVTIKGKYFAHVKGGNEQKPYEITVRMSESHKEAGFLSVFKNLVAPKVMRERYPDYGDGLASHEIVKVVDLSNPDKIINDPMLMNLSQLSAYIEKNQLPVEVGLYKDLDELKQAVVDCLDDETVFVEQQAKRKAVRTKDLELTNELAALNEGIEGGLALSGTEPIDPASVPTTEGVTLPAKPKTEYDGEDRLEKEIDPKTGKVVVKADDISNTDDDLGI